MRKVKIQKKDTSKSEILDTSQVGLLNRNMAQS